jgi:hypothetical protein
MRRRRLKRRLFWIGVRLAVTTLALVGHGLRAGEAISSAARRSLRPMVRPDYDGRI